ncbi:7-carboxy-7-deazaguanine synthase QueE [Gilliamella apicola]|uniref:7-carboxy-7-deazaguanine synthase QueE n=1 Tax=Gilliamella apicola TaxID=1196095 RepID=UPI00042E608D|nr:7-carboxy-7-deazaguanine synthase QueE [Gilliamella apicola]AHN26425.1 Queuosine Biosynthesis QueE Radical SAM [Gilliamella apicola]OCG11606.1 radical SAM protein [Gilliamella apicola]ORF45661.1 radical SAM protein [Gilliamella apicola]ORF49905.1 radical SAM protein [Gilliamella apicola]ORF52585.1 radical SAM protein [Gilliamella apicola]
MTEFRIVEIFESLQGEGYNTGMPAIFIRFAGCNLNCVWCDTNFRQYTRFTLEQLLTKVKQYTSKNIIITGGEPTMVKALPELLLPLKQAGYYIAIESNGLGKVDPLIDYIALSPKFCYQARYQKIAQPTASEVRIVAENHADFLPFCQYIEQNIQAKRYYLSPCEKNGEFNMFETIELLGKINQNRNDNKWLLSIQTHKFANIE